MSGIAGIIRFGGAPIDPALLDGMMQCLTHRGPDGTTSWISESAVLGQCMLHTTSESLEEVQPTIDDEHRKILVMDGRIDNWEELRTNLQARGARLRNRGDAELVLRSFETWGEACVEHLEGDFAFAILDLAKRELFCARDALGNKPFVYHWDGTTLSFASELSALLSLPWVLEVPNEGMIAEIIASELMSVEETLWTGILRLPAAHSMLARAGNLARKTYWTPDLAEELGYTTEGQYIEHYRGLLTEQIRRLSRSHRPVAIEASGGLDSSAVLAVAHMLECKGQFMAPSLRGYTLAIEGYPDCNDLPYARSLAHFLQIPIEEVPPTLDYARWCSDIGQSTRDFPGHPNGSWNLGINERATQSGARVLLTGTFADQLIAGSNLHYVEDLIALDFKSLVASLGHDLKDRGILGTIDLVLRQGVLPLLPDRIEQKLRELNRGGNHAILQEPFWLEAKLRAELVERRQSLQTLPRDRRCTAGQRALLSSLYSPGDCLGRELNERTGARSGLEVRQPFATKNFAQFAISTPERLRSRGKQGKYIHRMAMTDLLPPDVLTRVDKAGFTGLAGNQIRQRMHYLEASLAQARTGGVTETGIKQLLAFWEKYPNAGSPVWIISRILGCDSAFSL